MKKDRNCGITPYPVYQPYQPINTGMMMPGMMTPNMMPGMMAPGLQYDTQNDFSNQSNMDTQLNQIQRQINNLETRVSKLEGSMNMLNNSSFNSTQYSSGNYHIV